MYISLSIYSYKYDMHLSVSYVFLLLLRRLCSHLILSSIFFFILVYCLTDTSTYTLAQLEMDTRLTILVCGLWPGTLGIVITKNCTLTLFFSHALKFLPFHVALLNINQVVSSAYHPIPVLFCLTHPQSSRWERLYVSVLAVGN